MFYNLGPRSCLGFVKGLVRAWTFQSYQLSLQQKKYFVKNIFFFYFIGAKTLKIVTLSIVFKKCETELGVVINPIMLSVGYSEILNSLFYCSHDTQNNGIQHNIKKCDTELRIRLIVPIKGTEGS